MRRTMVYAVVGLVACGCWAAARAEVRAITDHNGEYSMTRVLRSRERSSRLLRRGGLGDVWRPVGRGAGLATLNPDGALFGDLWPSVAESPVGARLPWVVWSRHRGADYDLVWSRWNAGTWQPVQWVAPDPAPAGDDLDPRIGFDQGGRPHVVWWRDEQGRGVVYLSMFLDTRWSEPFRVTTAAEDSRYPELVSFSGATVRIRYATPAGTIVRTIGFVRPTTITDDINPLDYWERGEFEVERAQP